MWIKRFLAWIRGLIPGQKTKTVEWKEVDMNPMADIPRPTPRRYHRNHKTKGAFGNQPKGV